MELGEGNVLSRTDVLVFLLFIGYFFASYAAVTHAML